MIRVFKNINSFEDINLLRNKVNFKEYNEDIFEESFSHNLFSISLYDDDILIGYGRIIGDKYNFIYIHNVMVDPNYQNMGIGTRIINLLLDEALSYKEISPDLRIYLNSVKDYEGFYFKRGFVLREDLGLGPALVYLDKKNE